ncbi:DNA-binding helix-turn-helix protein [Enterococcus faecalis 13-SD-W-01]|nr:DNA-binding helix-turn-helix protein [Enterococcus faecalis 13-SD-W-01]
MPNHASLIRKIRKERGLTQEQLTLDISQRGTLAAFESRGTKIGFELLTKYLERMNITLTEYQFLLNNNELTSKQKLANLLASQEKELSEEQEKALLDEYEKTGDIYYRILYAQKKLIRGYLRNPSLTPFMKQEIAVIKNHLDRIDTWGHFELSIFSNCLFLFDDEYIFYSFNQSVTKMEMYINTTYYSDLISNFLLNGVYLAFNRASLPLRKLFLGELKKTALTYNKTIDLAYYKVFSAFDKLVDGNPSSIGEINTGIAFFEWLGLTEAVNYLTRLKEQHYQPYKNSSLQ